MIVTMVARVCQKADTPSWCWSTVIMTQAIFPIQGLQYIYHLHDAPSAIHTRHLHISAKKIKKFRIFLPELQGVVGLLQSEILKTRFSEKRQAFPKIR